MNEGWQTVPLGEVASPVSRSIFVQAGQSYRTIGVKWWGEGAYERQTIDGSQTVAKTLSFVRENDLIINKIWVRHGSAAIATQAEDGCAASGEFPTFTLNRERIEPRWLHWQTKTPGFWAKCDALSQGTSGKNRIKPELFLTVPIPLPPLPEQRRLVARIEALAEKIGEARGLRKQAEEQVDRLFEAKLRAAVTEHPADVKNLPLTELAHLERRPVNVDPNTKYHEIGVYCFGKGIFHKLPRTGMEVGDKDLCWIKDGDLILQVTFAWEGAVALAGPKEEGRCGSVRYLTFRANEDLCTARYLLTYLKTTEGIAQLGKVSPGSAGRNRVLSMKRLNEVIVPVIPKSAQTWLTDGLQAQVDAVKQLQAQTAAELDALLPSVLDKAFRGEL